MAVDLFFEYWLAMFLFPHKYAILFLFLKHPLSVFLIVDVSFPIVPFLLADDYFLQSNINNSHFWSLDHSSVFPVFLKSSIVDSMATRVLLVDIIYQLLYYTHQSNLNNHQSHVLQYLTNNGSIDFCLTDGRFQYPLKKKKKYFGKFLESSQKEEYLIIHLLRSSHPLKLR